MPSPRVTHACVEFNGRPLGLDVVIEPMNKDFLRHNFGHAKGNLYEAYLQDIDQKLDPDNGKDSSQSDVKALLEVTKIPDRSNRWERLNQVLDVDRYVAHLVVELFTSHTDGYAMNRNNYPIYHDAATGRFVFFGHGIDWAFANTEVSIVPPESSLVTRAVLQTPPGRSLFNQRRAELFTNIFRLEILTNRVTKAVAKLKAAARDANEARQFQSYGDEMPHRIMARHQSILEQFARLERKPLAFDTAGVAGMTELLGAPASLPASGAGGEQVPAWMPALPGRTIPAGGPYFGMELVRAFAPSSSLGSSAVLRSSLFPACPATRLFYSHSRCS